MAINTLNFLNKNQFRSYPLKADSLLVAVDGKKITNELFVGLSVSTTAERKNLFIRQVVANKGNISVTLAAEIDNRYYETLGTFQGDVNQDFTTLQLNSYMLFTSGNLVIGSSEAVASLSGVYTFHKKQLLLEESTIFYYTPPPVKSVVNEGKTLKGNVKFGVLNNIVKSKQANNILLGVIDSSSVASLADKHSAFNNCNTPVIRYIDGAVPFYDNSGYYPELQGNLFMVGVAPIIFYGEQGENTVDPNNLPIYNGGISVKTITAGNKPLTLDTLCTTSNLLLPPVNPNYIHNFPDDTTSSPLLHGNQSYYTKSRKQPSNFISTTEPEFTWWPQFLSVLTPNAAIPTEENTIKTVGTIPALNSAKKLLAVSLFYTGMSNITINILHNNTNLDDYQNIEIKANQSTTILGKTLINVVEGDTFDVEFVTGSSGASFLIPYILYR